MLCERESLFTNSTRVPCEIVSCEALTPAEVMVIVVVGGAAAAIRPTAPAASFRRTTRPGSTGQQHRRDARPRFYCTMRILPAIAIVTER